jgi:hypothetical protein
MSAQNVHDEILALTNMVGMRKFNLGDTVTFPIDACPDPGCGGMYTGKMVGRIVGFAGTSKLEDDGHVGPFYVVEVDHPHNGGVRLVCAEAELGVDQ